MCIKLFTTTKARARLCRNFNYTQLKSYKNNVHTIFCNVVIKWSYEIQIVIQILITHNCNHTKVMHTTMKMADINGSYYYRSAPIT